jgi:DNA-binding transcriptional ArsR family regulator
MREQIRLFKALSSESRLKVLLLLKEHPQCVHVIASRLKMTQPAASQHLRALKEAGLVKAEKRGTFMHYAMNPRGVKGYGKAMAGIFGGWARLQQSGKGTANCPPKLLKECQGGQTSRHSRQHRTKEGS